MPSATPISCWPQSLPSEGPGSEPEISLPPSMMAGQTLPELAEPFYLLEFGQNIGRRSVGRGSAGRPHQEGGRTVPPRQQTFR